MSPESTDRLVLSLADYAEHRGVSKPTVSQYKREGRLVLTDDGQVDVVASDALLAATLDPLRGGDRTGATDKPSAKGGLAAERLEGERIKNARQHLALQRDAEVLVDKDGVNRAAFSLARSAQEAMMGVPDRVAVLLAAESDPAKCHEMLSKEMRTICNNLATAARECFE